MPEHIEKKIALEALSLLAVDAALDTDGEELVKACMRRLGNIPAADVAPVVHGRWIGIEYDGYADGYPVWDVYECSVCGCEHNGERDTLTEYCPNCGAKMDKEGAE